MNPQLFIAERFVPGETEATARAAMEALRTSCERLAADGVEIRYLGGTFVLADEATSCRFAGPAAAVRAVHENAGLRIDRLLPVIEVASHTAEQ